MNDDIATQATAAVDGALQVEDQLLDAFAGTLADLRREYSAEPGEELLPVVFPLTRHRIRLREMNIALARAVNRLYRAGHAPWQPRTPADGFFHTVDPRVSFTTCSTCGGSTVWAPPCHFGDAA